MNILGAFEFCVLSTIKELKTPCAAEIKEHLQFKKAKCSTSASYTTLFRLRDKGFITSTKQHSDYLGRSIFHYKITKLGRKVCKKFEKQVKEFL